MGRRKVPPGTPPPLAPLQYRYQHALYINPINTPCNTDVITLSTHPIHLPYHHTTSYPLTLSTPPILYITLSTPPMMVHPRPHNGSAAHEPGYSPSKKNTRRGATATSHRSLPRSSGSDNMRGLGLGLPAADGEEQLGDPLDYLGMTR